MKLLRSLLFVPGNRQKMLDKARSFACDAVILDLEDAVPPAEKAAARTMVRTALETGGFRAPVAVRVNDFGTGQTENDLEAVVLPGLAAVCLPKAGKPADVERLDSLLGKLEREGGLQAGSLAVLLLIETALGVIHAYRLATASKRVRALCFGGEDFCRDVGALRTKEGLEISHARGQILIAARAAGVAAVDTVYTDVNDQKGLLAEARLIRQMGYSGKLLVHPAQIEALHRAFAPTADEIDYAHRVMKAFEEAALRGEGVFSLDGKMIDEPIKARAREILMLAEECSRT